MGKWRFDPETGDLTGPREMVCHPIYCRKGGPTVTLIWDAERGHWHDDGQPVWEVAWSGTQRFRASVGEGVDARLTSRGVTLCDADGLTDETLRSFVERRLAEAQKGAR